MLCFYSCSSTLRGLTQLVRYFGGAGQALPAGPRSLPQNLLYGDVHTAERDVSACVRCAISQYAQHVMLQDFILIRTPGKRRGYAQLPADSLDGDVHAAERTSVLASAAPAQTQGSF